MSAGRATAQGLMRHHRLSFAASLREMKRGCAAFYDMHRDDTERALRRFRNVLMGSQLQPTRLP
ncbi:hypothetical protein FDH02_gp40 [Pseudomonas phage VSW-3]|uniref:Uncharacterized protein n=1 Tax=Pseudomonas phage VSW-3 TaxID=1852562 RepID=A0A173GCR6_9CAUD|nr:hypothetical protein FDH02_gp40 [Pseudomonas phage VSW-3]ANH51116.1 hypothetical protein VSW3_40 [Pseudomonas phage VSW-3]